MASLCSGDQVATEPVTTSLPITTIPTIRSSNCSPSWILCSMKTWATLNRVPGTKTSHNGRRYGKTVLRSEEHTSELQSQSNLVCRLLLEKKKNCLFGPLTNTQS